MVEQADVGHSHRHAVFVSGLDDVVVADGAAGLGDVLHAALAGALDVVAEGEEGVGAEADIVLGLFEPGLFFLPGENGRFLGKDALPSVGLQ